jgi:hypothetical protein
MLTVVGDTALIVRDLSHENLASIFWLVGTALSCFIAALVGLIPEMLLAWTLHLPNPLFAVLTSALAVVLSVVSLTMTLPAISFVIIGLIGSISFCRKMGSPQVYKLVGHATLSINGFVLEIMYPDAPEAMIDLNMLNTDDQRHLLYLLRERWVCSLLPWNPQLGEEIEVALGEAERAAVLV